jgi:transposase
MQWQCVPIPKDSQGKPALHYTNICKAFAKSPKRGRQRCFNAAIHALRTRVDRAFAWEDKFTRLLLRFEHRQQRHYGMKLLMYTLINLRPVCGA